MPTKLCRDRILEVLESVSEPLFTRQVADTLLNDSLHNVSQNLRWLWKDHLVIRTGQARGGRKCQWQIRQVLPPLEIMVYEEDSETDRKACAKLDWAIASVRRGWEQRQ